MLQTKGVLDYNTDHMEDPCSLFGSVDQDNRSKNGKTDQTTDLDFLKHMIPHHQVAIDMSKEIMKYTNDPSIIYLARNIIYKQSDEILFMENVLLSYIPNMSSKDKYLYEEIPNQFTVYYPLKSRAKPNSHSQCTKHHFDPKLMHNHKLTEKEYLNHMIPHHDIAIEMAQRVIKYSPNPLMVDFAYGIIKNQRYEIWLMKDYLLNSQTQCSSYFKSQ